MPQKNQNIHRIKEAALLVLFFLFVFSFSGKSFGRSVTEQKHKVPAVVAIHTVNSILTAHTGFKNNALPPLLIKSVLFDEQQLATRLFNTSLTALLRFTTHCFLHHKPQLHQQAYMALARKTIFPELL